MHLLPLRRVERARLAPNAQVNEQGLRLRRADILPRAPYPARLDLPACIDAIRPRVLDHVLQPQDAGRAAAEMLAAVGLRFLNVRHEHLDVAVAAEAALARHLDDVLDGRVAQEDFGDGRVGGAELREDGHDARGFVGHALDAHDAAVRGDLVLERDFGARFELFVEPGWHALFVGVWAELRFLVGGLVW